MDGQHFDDLIKQICTTKMTRLTALRGVVAGAAAAITGLALVAPDAEAKKGRKGDKSKKAKNKKSGGPTGDVAAQPGGAAQPDLTAQQEVKRPVSQPGNHVRGVAQQDLQHRVLQSGRKPLPEPGTAVRELQGLGDAFPLIRHGRLYH